MRVAAPLAFAILTLFATACGTGTAATNGKTQVMAAFYPLAWVSQQVAGPDAAVTNLTGQGTEPHDLELTPREIAKISDAGLVVTLKGMQPAVDEAVAQHAADKSLELSATIDPLDAEGHEEEGHEEEGHEEEGHEHASDPHFWLDPTRMAKATKAVAARLAEADPAHANGYIKRGDAVAKKLTKLDGDFKTGLAKCTSKTFVTSHAAFAYLADRYGLHQEAIAGIDPTNEPAPKRIAEVQQLVKDEKVTTVFTEAKVSDKVARTLARDAGVKTDVLEPLESAPAEGGYIEAMQGNLGRLQKALGCS